MDCLSFARPCYASQLRKASFASRPLPPNRPRCLVENSHCPYRSQQGRGVPLHGTVHWSLQGRHEMSARQLAPGAIPRSHAAGRTFASARYDDGALPSTDSGPNALCSDGVQQMAGPSLLGQLLHRLRQLLVSACRAAVVAAALLLCSLILRPAASYAATASTGPAAQPGPCALPARGQAVAYVVDRVNSSSAASSSGRRTDDHANPHGARAARWQQQQHGAEANAVPAAALNHQAAAGSGGCTTTSASQYGRPQEVLSGLSAAAATTAPPSAQAAAPADALLDSSAPAAAAATGLYGTALGSGAALVPGALDPEVLELAQRAGISVAEASVVRLFERNRPSVVNITHMRAMQSFHTLDIHKMPYGQGSGFVWDARGHVVTNYHVIKGAAEVKVTLHDHSTYTAKVVGFDAAKDVAVLKLSMPKSKLRELQPITPGASGQLCVGQAVYAIGNPYGLDHTLTKGIVSGLGRELSVGLYPIKNVIQTDCAVNPGNSGGVLLDSKGQSIGVCVAIVDASGKGSFSGVSFAVPMDAVRGLVEQILAYGRTIRPALGITIAPAQILSQAGVEGVLVLEVPPGSPAQAAGLRPTHRDIFGDIVLGDIITSMDGKAVRSYSDLYGLLDEHRVGDRIKLDLLRDGKAASVTVTLGERVLGQAEE